MRPADIKIAPGGLALLQAFVNTLYMDKKIDQLTDPDALRSWLVGLLRLLDEPVRQVVLHGRVWEPDEGQGLPRAAPGRVPRRCLSLPPRPWGYPCAWRLGETRTGGHRHGGSTVTASPDRGPLR